MTKTITMAAALALAAPALADSADRIISKRAGEYHVQLTLRPGEPKPGRLLEVAVELARVPDFPDPVYGDRIPINDADLVVTLAPATPDLAASKNRLYKLHHLDDGGQYGFHSVPETGGVYTLEIRPRSGKGPTVSFDIGVGVAMATEVGEGKKAASRRPASGAGGGRMVVSSVGPKSEMAEIGQRWPILEQIASTGSLGTAAAQSEARAIAALLGKAKEKPPKSANPADEYLGMLGSLAAEFNAIAANTDGTKTAKLVAATEQTCMKCHVRYRWELTRDLSRWPKFDVAGGATAP